MLTRASLNQETVTYLSDLVRSIRTHLPIPEDIRRRRLTAVRLDVETVRGGAKVLSFDELNAIATAMGRIVSNAMDDGFTAEEASDLLLIQIDLAEKLLASVASK